MKRYFFGLICVMLVVASGFASPVFRTQHTVRQSDGSVITVTRTGANHILYYITEDGFPVFPNVKGDYCYAEFDDDFNVVAGTVIAHEASKRTPMEQRCAQEALDNFETALKMHNLTRYGVGDRSQASVSSTGDVKIAVILAEFQDLSFKAENTIDKFRKHLNAENYTEEGGAGSLRDYFVAQSDGLFRPQFDIVAKVKVSKNCSDYGGNSGGNDKNDRGYVSEAVDLAYKAGVDFAPYLNSKGELFTIVIYPGHGEQVSGSSDAIWAQYLYNLSYTVGKHKLVAGLVMDELANYGQGEQFDGIGTLAHEFSHALGLPDLYNTTSASNIFGMDAWSIMDYGQFNNLSRTPVGYTSYEREFMGWLKIDTLQDYKQLVTLAPLHTKEPNRAYRILNKADKSNNEYYIIENRQESPWYLKLYGEGMLVIHVDYLASAWTANTINNNYSHQRMTIIPADGVLSRISSKASDYKGDLFPGYKKKQTFTTPDDVAYTGGHMNIKMTNIYEIGDNIEFYYQCDGKLATPQNLVVEAVDATTINVKFDAVEHADKYIVNVFKGEEQIGSETITQNSVNISGLATDTEYIVLVVAIADDYLDSDSKATIFQLVGGIKGDVNNDGAVNAGDVVSIYNYIILGEESGVKLIRADVNKDSYVNAADVTTIYNIVIGADN